MRSEPSPHPFFGQLACVLLFAAVLLLLVVPPAVGLAGQGPTLPVAGGEPAAASPSTQLVLPLSAGAWVDQQTPDASPFADFSVGKVNQVVAVFEHRTFLKFDLSKLPANAQITSATLRVYKLSGAGEDPTNVAVAACTGSWSASSVTWNSQPTVGSLLRPVAVAHLPAPAWHSIDVLSLMKYWLNGNPNYGLRLSADQISDVTIARGRSGPAPELEVLYVLPASTPTATDTPTAAPTATFTRTPTTRTTNTPTRTRTPTATAPAGSAVVAAVAHGWVQSSLPATNNSGSPALRAGWSGVSAGDMSYVQFDIPEFEGHGCYKSAKLGLYQVMAPEPPGYPLAVEVVQAGWREDTLNWNNAPGGQPGAVVALEVNNGTGWQIWDVSAAANKWRAGVVQNNGLRVVGARLDDGSPVLGERVFGSRLSANPPRLEAEWMADWAPPVVPAFSSSHAEGAWSNQAQVNVDWSSATDGSGCGIDGFAYSWSNGPYDEPAYQVNTYATALSGTMSEGKHWFHLRVLDMAGNWSEAFHHGPVQIDITPPSCTVSPLAAHQGTSSFPVSWSGADALSGVAGYDVQYRVGGGAWADWLGNTSGQSASFNGQNGSTYGFRCRSRDTAGNTGNYSPAVSTTVGVQLSIEVTYHESWYNVSASGAKVYRNGEFAGLTDTNGQLNSVHWLQGDTLAVLYPLRTVNSPKRPTEALWTAYATNATIPAVGDPELYVFGDPATLPNPLPIELHGDHPVIGFRVVFSVEWDAPAAYLNDLREGALRASNFLYDVTDGQAFFENIAIYDNRKGWDWGDYRVQLNNQTWPCGDVGGMDHGSWGDHHIYVGRTFGRGGFTTFSWTNADAYPTLIHEFGHYGLGLYDEYKKRDGSGGGSCATGFASRPQASRSSIMYHEWESSELCSSFDANHHHSSDTEQDARNNGESTWQTFLRRYGDPSSSIQRYTLESPVERGAIVPGPDAIPGNWVSTSIENALTGACPPFDLWLTYGDGTAVNEALVWLDRTDGDLVQGLTDANGYIQVFGAHNGDTLLAEKDGAWASMVVSCSAGPAATDAAPRLSLQTPAFPLGVSIDPVGAQTLDIGVAAPGLAAAPVVEVTQVAGQGMPVAMTWDAGRSAYRGQAVLPEAGGTQGYVRVEATNDAGQSVLRMISFKLLPVSAGTPSDVRSADNAVEITFPAGSLLNGAIVSINDGGPGATSQGDLVRVGSVYVVAASGGQTKPAAPAPMIMRYSAGARIDAATLQVHRWDPAAGRWTPLISLVDPELRLVSAQITELGSYAVLGEPAAASLYLPVLSR